MSDDFRKERKKMEDLQLDVETLQERYQDADDNTESAQEEAVVSTEAKVVVSEKPKKENVFICFLKYWFPWQGDNAKEVIRKIIMLISVITLIVCGVIIGQRIYQRIQSDKQNDALIQQINPNIKWEDLDNLYPGVEFPEGMNPKWAHLYATNQDFVGWLQIKNTKVDFPIVKGKDNNFYLRRDFNKKDTQYGNPYMDARNNIQPMSRNTIIYGHHMRDQQIFSTLLDYTKIDYFKSAPLITFESLFEAYNFKIYAVFLTNGYNAQDNGYTFEFNIPEFTSDETFATFMKEIDKRKIYTTGVDLKSNDKIIMLSTCAYNFEEARFVVIGRMVREGESLEVDTSKAYKNQNPRYPQAYYDKRREANPYKDDHNWKRSEA